MRYPHILLLTWTLVLLPSCVLFQKPVTDATHVRGIRAADSVLVLRNTYKSWRVELPAGVYRFMPDFSSARAVSYVSPAPVRKREALLPFLWSKHELAWLVIPADGAPQKLRPRWVVWANGSSDYLGDDFTYEIHSTRFLNSGQIMRHETGPAVRQ